MARSYLDKAKLTGKFADYLAAEEALDEAFALAKPESGPKLARATLNYAIHRIPQIEADLVQAESAIIVSREDRRAIREIRADVLLNTGKYKQAKDAFEQLEAESPSVTSATRLANYYREIADFTSAEKWLDIAEERNGPRNPQLRSWIWLQRGILHLDRGQLDEALANYEKGLSEFSGYWLLEEHIAEINALQGNHQQAEQQYRELIERTDSPLFMTALADVLTARSDKASQTEAQGWLERSASIYRQRIRTLPELVSGHALDYFLLTGTGESALQLALNNYRLRPAGESALQLVQAYSVNRQLSEAEALLDSIFRSPYRSASLHATAAVVFRTLEKPELSVEQEALALAISPLAMADIDWLHQRLLAQP